MKYYNTKYEGITSYETSKGKLYRVRIVYLDRKNIRREHSKQGFKTVNEALRYKTNAEIEFSKDNAVSVVGSDITLQEQWENYSEYKISEGLWNKSSIKNSKYKIQKWIDKFGEYKLSDISKDDVNQYIKHLYKVYDYSQETIESYFKMFMQVIDDAVEDGNLEKNVFKKVSYKKSREWRAKPKTITIDEYQEFMSLAKDNMRQDVYRCLMLLTFGLRKSEAYAVRTSSITFLDNGMASINIDKARVPAYPEGTRPKTQNSERIVVVDEVMANQLNKQIEYAKQVKQTFNMTLHKDDYIFISPENGMPYPYKTLNDHIDKITVKMDNPIRLTPHMFRHMFATIASASGVDWLQLVKYLGHGDREMTNHYTGSIIEGGTNVVKMTEQYRKVN